MRIAAVRNEDRDRGLGDRIRIADRWWSRLRGMIGHPEPRGGEGLLIRPCQGVHMQWMSYPLDVAFLDPDGRVVAAYHELRPWRFSKTHREATAALELPSGTLHATGTRVGDLLSWQESESAAA
ncbi:MAG: DUF192 domain-containing protein [Gemmatimonadetes bacterium]|nr:DUF192 domain-containing protein [Gemmatimonadota bacterium]